MHSTPSSSSSTCPTFTGLQRLITSRIPCADPREPRGDGFTDPEPRTSYEPNRTVDNPTITEQEIAATIQQLTSQVPELQERKNYLNDSGEVPEVESNYSGNFSNVPSQTNKDSKSAVYAELR